jgi:hypothetical protein
MSLLERLRQKPDRQKKMIALTVAIIVAVIVTVAWLMAQSAMQTY